MKIELAELEARVRQLRKNDTENMPSTKAIGRHLAAGRYEQAHRDALHREFLRGRIDACGRILDTILATMPCHALPEPEEP